MCVSSGVAGDVERHAEEDVAAALVQLARELVALDVELEQRVAGRQRDFFGFFRVPAADEEAPALRVAFDLREHARDLIDAVGRVAALGLGGSEVAPLVAVHRAEVTGVASEARSLLGGRPFVPDGDAAFAQPVGVGLAAEKPEELDDDGANVHLLRGEQRKARGEIEAHLVTEQPEGTRTRAIFAGLAFGQDLAQQSEVRMHAFFSSLRVRREQPWPLPGVFHENRIAHPRLRDPCWHRSPWAPASPTTPAPTGPMTRAPRTLRAPPAPKPTSRCRRSTTAATRALRLPTSRISAITARARSTRAPSPCRCPGTRRASSTRTKRAARP